MGRSSHLIENLEHRRLLSASILVKDGTLIFHGTPRSDQIIVSDRDANIAQGYRRRAQPPMNPHGPGCLDAGAKRSTTGRVKPSSA